jgi:Right handed beta helix region
LLIQDSYLHDYMKMPTKNIAYSENASSVTLERCHISNYWQVNFINTPVLMDSCLLEYIAEDGIDLDNSPSAIIRNCIIRNGLCEKGKIHSVDAID